MTETQMFEHMRTQIRTEKLTPLHALSNTLKKAGSEIKPYYKGESHLYVRCDGIPWDSISTIHFLANSQKLKCRIVALSTTEQFKGQNITICKPYINIYE